MTNRALFFWHSGQPRKRKIAPSVTARFKSIVHDVKDKKHVATGADCRTWKYVAEESGYECNHHRGIRISHSSGDEDPSLLVYRVV
jgi:hypothetical protein